MTLNQLFDRQQISLTRAAAAASLEARCAHRGLAKGYGDRIAALRRARIDVEAIHAD